MPQRGPLMSAQANISEVAESRSWRLAERSERTGTLGALDQWDKDGNSVRVFYSARGAVRTGWVREGNQDFVRINGQHKEEKIIRYLKTGFLS
ncbi:hypothetical protein [Mycobacteroides sp. PCS013]|uniref:hypothetical protein n=1 Tax=Mycobacteroides sp. PCS013 TaxID=3074106 RepID=UPI003C2FAE71